MKRLLEIQTELKCNKSQFNKFGGYSYRSCEDILQAVKPLLKKHGVALTLDDAITVPGEGRFYVMATATLLDAETGKVISSVNAYAREAEQKKGMDEAQVTGSASSYARKYALNGLFLLDDCKDADTNEYNEEENKSAKPKAKSAKVKEEPKEEPKAEEPKKASVQQLQVIQDLILKTGKKEEDICKAYKVKKLQDVTVENAAEIYKVLRHYEEEQ